MNELIQDQTALILVVLLSAAVIAIAILSVVVYVLSKKLKDSAKEPRYGFLNKPLNYAFIAIFSSIAFGVSSMYLFVDFSSVEEQESISVSVTQPLDTEINFEVIDSESFLYKFSAVPVVDGEEWGLNAQNEFNVNWVFSSDIDQIFKEELISLNDPGGVEYALLPGNNTISVTVEYQGFVIKDEIRIRRNQ